MGTRMRPLSIARPKPLIPIANRPLLEYQVSILRQAGIIEIVFGTNYLAEQIVDHFGDGSRFGVQMSYRVEPEPMDTAGAIRFAVEGLSPKRCVVFNGDTLHDFDLGSILETHETRRAEITLTLYRVARPHPFGIVPLDESGRVMAFIEPTKEQKLAAQQGAPADSSDLINAGLYVLEPEVVDQIPLRRCSIEREFFPSILERGGAVYGHDATGVWTDVGRPALLLDATRDLLAGNLALSHLIPGQLIGGYWTEGAGDAYVSASIEAGCHIGRDATIGEGAVLKDQTVVGRGCRIGDDTVLDGCILHEEVSVGSHCELSRCIVDRQCVISDNVRATEIVLAAGSVLNEHSALGHRIT